jgi:8-oxo-dGTP pyrophosphatase MutT (NUDIX family)
MFHHPDWIERLGQRLQAPLPGLEAQMRMAPDSRQALLKAQNFIIPDDAKRSAVLMLVYPSADGFYMPLIERAAYDGVHSRQIGLPGGQTEPGDLDAIDTALREAEEEIGVSRHHIEVLGLLSSLYIPPSNFHVQPVLAVTQQRPAFVLDPVEVASLIETPLMPLLQGQYRGQSTVQVRGGAWQVPSFSIQGHVVWGATAMMLSELVAVMGEVR